MFIVGDCGAVNMDNILRIEVKGVQYDARVIYHLVCYTTGDEMVFKTNHGESLVLCSFNDAKSAANGFWKIMNAYKDGERIVILIETVEKDVETQ